MGDGTVKPDDAGGAAEGAGSAASTAAANEETSKAADAAETPQSAQDTAVRLRRGLLRKISQLNKVVVQLNGRIAEGDAKCERMVASTEEDINTMMKDAALKVEAFSKQTAQVCNPASIAEEAARRQAPWHPEREAAKEELLRLKHLHEQERTKIETEEAERLQGAAKQLRTLAASLRDAAANFKEVSVRSREEVEERDAELQGRRREELEAAEAERKRRLDELSASHSREIQNLDSVREQGLIHLRRLHESEVNTLRMQALQKRRDKVHRMEQDFSEERRSLEQVIGHVKFELSQHRMDAEDVGMSGTSVQQHVDTLRVSLQEMKTRVDQAEAEVRQAREEAAQREAEVASLQSQVAVLQVRQRAGKGGAGGKAGAAQVGEEMATGTAALSTELREAMIGVKRLEAELQQSDMELANLDDDLTEREKEVEILEVELEDARIRGGKLQQAILKQEATLRR